MHTLGLLTNARFVSEARNSWVFNYSVSVACTTVRSPQLYQFFAIAVSTSLEMFNGSSAFRVVLVTSSDVSTPIV